jgi:hypothetical protein
MVVTLGSAKIKLPFRWRATALSTWALVLSLLLIFAPSIAAPDLDKTQALARERYGVRAAETIAAWRRLMVD